MSGPIKNPDLQTGHSERKSRNLLFAFV